MAEILIVTHLFAAGIGLQLGVWLSRRVPERPSTPRELSPEEAVRLGEGA